MTSLTICNLGVGLVSDAKLRDVSVPACLWFLAKDKTRNGRSRRVDMLFIAARKLGRLETKVNRVFDKLLEVPQLH